MSSCRTVVYKGLLLADQVGTVFPATSKTSAACRPWALVHQRFSAPTPFPSGRWRTPTGMVAHNGEINTVKGNYNWMKRPRRRDHVLAGAWRGDLPKLYPISFSSTSPTPPPSTTALELLTMAGYPLGQAVDDDDSGSPGSSTRADGRAQERAFYEYHAAMLEPWDGPAVDRLYGWTSRSGRRWTAMVCDRRATCITDDDLVIMASESGVLPVPENRIVQASGACSPARCS